MINAAFSFCKPELHSCCYISSIHTFPSRWGIKYIKNSAVLSSNWSLKMHPCSTAGNCFNAAPTSTIRFYCISTQSGEYCLLILLVFVGQSRILSYKIESDAALYTAHKTSKTATNVELLNNYHVSTAKYVTMIVALRFLTCCYISYLAYIYLLFWRAALHLPLGVFSLLYIYNRFLIIQKYSLYLFYS